MKAYVESKETTLLMGLYMTPPDLWSLDCLNTSIVDCEPIPLKYKNVIGGPWWASLLETVIGEFCFLLYVCYYLNNSS